MPVPIFTVGEVLTAANMNAVGLWRVTTCTVTSVGGTAATASNGVITIGTGNTSVTINSAFSSDFRSYRIVMDGIVGSVTSGNLELQLAGITSSTYSMGGTFFTYGSAVVSGYGPPANTRWLAAGAINNVNSQTIIDVMAPNAATSKAMFAQSSTTTSYYSLAGTCTSTSTATGFVLTPNAGTMTGGTVRVYGYRN